jgi:uncharacterized protein YcfJ
MTSFCDVGRKGSVEVGDTVSSLFSRPKAQNVPAAASAANVSAQNDADAQTRELRRREAAARNARTRGRSEPELTMADGESPSFSAGEVGNVVGSVIGGLLGGALGPAGGMIGAAVGGKAGSAVGNSVGGSIGTNAGGTTTNEQGVDTSLDDFAVNDGYGPGAAGPSTAPGSMPDVVQSMVDAAPGAGGDMGTINRTDPPPMSAPAAPPSVTADTVSVTMDSGVTNDTPPAAPAAPVTPPVTPASLADNRGPVRVIRGRGARRLLLYDAQSQGASTLGGA